MCAYVFVHFHYGFDIIDFDEPLENYLDTDSDSDDDDDEEEEDDDQSSCGSSDDDHDNDDDDDDEDNDNNQFKAAVETTSTLCRNKPKRRVIVSKEIDLAIERLIVKLTDHYIFSWYEPLIVNSSPTTQISIQHVRFILRYHLNIIYISFNLFIYFTVTIYGNYYPHLSIDYIREIMYNL